MTKIVFATGNQGKMKEIKMIFADTNTEIQSMKEAGIDIDIIEDGCTFEENALIKARAIAAAIQNGKENSRDTSGGMMSCTSDSGVEEVIVMADDSGLEIDYLNKEPGIYSARYMGSDTSYHMKNTNLIERLDGVPDEKRTARFVCAIAAVTADGTEYVKRATIEGQIGYKEAGENGFGYDPIFFLPEYGCTTAELPLEVKNKLSHRGKALEAMKAELMYLL